MSRSEAKKSELGISKQFSQRVQDQGEKSNHFLKLTRTYMSAIERWHSHFRPDKALSTRFLRNEVTETRENKKCIICSHKKAIGISLNGSSDFVCKSCLHEVSNTPYPSIYELKLSHYGTQKENRQQKFSKFKAKHKPKYEPNVAFAFTFLFLISSFLYPLILPLSAIAAIVALAKRGEKKRKRAKWNERKEKWKRDNPKPERPIPRHFHDPEALLTKYDLKILRIFRQWPGYPPHWNQLRKFVLKRDSHRCQVSGCPSRLAKHVHHQTPISKGGEHTPSNLVTLCEFHHSLEPGRGHELIWSKIKSKHLTVVKNNNHHSKSNNIGYVKRLKLVTEKEIAEIVDYYSISCYCNSENIDISLNSKLNIYCNECHREWYFEKGMPEEVGPKVATTLKVNENEGFWTFKPELLDKKLNNEVNQECPSCSKCGSTMKVSVAKIGGRKRKYWECTQEASSCAGMKVM